MDRSLSLGVAALFCALLLAPHANRITKLVPERKLHGAVKETQVVRPGWESIGSGAFQRATEERFNQRLPLRGWLVGLDAGLQLALLHETQPGSGVVVGEGGILYPESDVAFFNRPTAVSEEELRALAARVARVQRLLAARGQTLLLLVVPSKSSVYPAAIPPRWQRPLTAPRPADETYRGLIAALDAEGARYLDTRALLVRADAPPAFPPAGRHWSERAACTVLQELGRRTEASLATPLPPLACALVPGLDDPADDDHDLFRLTNALTPGPRASPTVRMQAEQHEGPRPTVLYVGTSFFWKLLQVALRTETFAEADYYYYNSKHHRFQGGLPVVPVEPHTPAWRERTLSRDLILVDAAEMFLPMAGSGFLEQLETALAE